MPDNSGIELLNNVDKKDTKPFIETLNKISLKEVNIYIDEIIIDIITGIDATMNALYRKASMNRKCSKECMPRNVPHPGHFNPVNTKNGHLGNHSIS